MYYDNRDDDNHGDPDEPHRRDNYIDEHENRDDYRQAAAAWCGQLSA